MHSVQKSMTNKDLCKSYFKGDKTKNYLNYFWYSEIICKRQKIEENSMWEIEKL